MRQIYKAETDVCSEKIADQIITALEGGSGYWLGSFKLYRSEIEPSEKPWYADRKLYEGDFEIICQPSEPGDFEDKHFSPQSIRDGLKVLAEKHHTVLADILMEEGDADTADVFLQCCLFGEVVYG